jgi:hypothetical protein
VDGIVDIVVNVDLAENEWDMMVTQPHNEQV